MTALFKRQAWMAFLGTLAVILAAGVALALVGDARSSAESDVWSDISRAGVQMALITAAGAVVTATFKYIDERHGRNEQRRQVFHEIVAAYNQVKAVRRNLRALGLVGTSPSHMIGAQQARELRTQMTSLIEAQLRFEAIGRELAQSGLFKNLGNIVSQLGTAEKYLSDDVLTNWELSGGQIWEGAPVSALVDLKLEGFIGDKERFPDFKKYVKRPLDDITETLHEQLFGRSPRSEKT